MNSDPTSSPPAPCATSPTAVVSPRRRPSWPQDRQAVHPEGTRPSGCFNAPNPPGEIRSEPSNSSEPQPTITTTSSEGTRPLGRFNVPNPSVETTPELPDSTEPLSDIAQPPPPPLTARKRVAFERVDPDSPLPPGPIQLKNPHSPGKVLYPYQLITAADRSRFIYCLQARQTGKDFAAAFAGIADCLEAEAAGMKTTWVIAAPSERQAMESFEKWKEVAAACHYEIEHSSVERAGNFGEGLLKSATITFRGGSRVIAVPGKPETVRGFSANLLLTEFAFFEDPDKTWRAILPSITNPLRGGPKKVRLITTPNGIGNKAHELWIKNYQVNSDGGANAPALVAPKPLSEGGSHPQSKWSCHKVDIYRAVADGLPVNIDELRAAVDDPEGWAQEFELNFLDRATILLPYELIAPCENPLATETAPADFWSSPLPSSISPPLFMGIDFGRQKDLTVCWTLALVGGAFRMTREVLCLEKMSTPEQVELLRPRLRRARRVAFDYTGPGVGMGDYLAKEFGEFNPAKHLFGKIELCSFTNDLKCELFSKLRMAFESRAIGIPALRSIREDLHSLSRVTLAGGGVTYRAPHTPDGHADRCTALALALRAAIQPDHAFNYAPVARADSTLPSVTPRPTTRRKLCL